MVKTSFSGFAAFASSFADKTFLHIESNNVFPSHDIPVARLYQYFSILVGLLGKPLHLVLQNLHLYDGGIL